MKREEHANQCQKIAAKSGIGARSYRKLPGDKVWEGILVRNTRPDILCSVRRFDVAAGIYIVHFFGVLHTGGIVGVRESLHARRERVDNARPAIDCSQFKRSRTDDRCTRNIRPPLSKKIPESPDLADIVSYDGVTESWMNTNMVPGVQAKELPPNAMCSRKETQTRKAG